ncbi:hypothetical protein ABFS82_11G126500 [Erythranthe guttata]
MGLFTYTVAGGALILLGAWESVISASESLKQTPPPHSPQNSKQSTPPGTASFSSTVTFLLISVLSVLFVVNSFISLSDVVASDDDVGFALQLEVIAIGFLFTGKR